MTDFGLARALAIRTSCSTVACACSHQMVPSPSSACLSRPVGPQAFIRVCHPHDHSEAKGHAACLLLPACAQPVLQAQAPLPKGPGNLSSSTPAGRSQVSLQIYPTSLPANRPGTFPACDVFQFGGIVEGAALERMLRFWFE